MPNATPAAGFNDGELYIIMNRDWSTAQLLPTLNTCAAYLTRHGRYHRIRAEHLQGVLIWTPADEIRKGYTSEDRMLDLMRERITRAVGAGYGRNKPEERGRINGMQRAVFA